MSVGKIQMLDGLVSTHCIFNTFPSCQEKYNRLKVLAPNRRVKGYQDSKVSMEGAFDANDVFVASILAAKPENRLLHFFIRTLQIREMAPVVVKNVTLLSQTNLSYCNNYLS